MILAIDQGTTGTTCLVVDDELRIAGRGYRELSQSYPQPGWVEHDPDEILRTVHEAAADALRAAGVAAAVRRSCHTIAGHTASPVPRSHTTTVSR